MDSDGKSYVWKFDSGSGAVSKHPVEIGTVMGNFIPVRAGLEKGDEIVSAGVAYLSDGQVVRRLN